MPNPDFRELVYSTNLAQKHAYIPDRDSQLGGVNKSDLAFLEAHLMPQVEDINLDPESIWTRFRNAVKYILNPPSMTERALRKIEKIDLGNILN